MRGGAHTLVAAAVMSATGRVFMLHNRFEFKQITKYYWRCSMGRVPLPIPRILESDIGSYSASYLPRLATLNVEVGSGTCYYTLWDLPIAAPLLHSPAWDQTTAVLSPPFPLCFLPLGPLSLCPVGRFLG